MKWRRTMGSARSGLSRSGAVVSMLVPISAAIVGAALLGRGTQSLWVSMVVVLWVVAAELVRIPTRSRIRFTAALAVVASLPIVQPVARSSIVPDLAGLTAPVAVGLAIVWAIRTARHEDAHQVLVDTTRRLMGSIAYMIVFAVVQVEIYGAIGQYRDLVAIGAGMAAAFLMELLVGLALRFDPRLESRLHIARREVADLSAYATIVAIGAWGGYVYLQFGIWVLAVAPILYLFADRAFRRLEDARQTYDETIRALARIPEVADQVAVGHADRTAELSGAVARRYRLGPDDVELITRAAYLHDIGRISMNDPGVAGLGATDAEIAGWGAEIVREASLDAEAEIISRQCEVFRHPGQPAETDLPLGARIIKACSSFDQGVSELGLSPLESMELLHRGSVYDFDPDVVDRLRVVLEARGSFGPAR